MHLPFQDLHPVLPASLKDSPTGKTWPKFSMVKRNNFHRPVLLIHSTKTVLHYKYTAFLLLAADCAGERYRCLSVPQSMVGSGITPSTKDTHAVAGEMEDHCGLSAPSPSSATSILLSNVIGPIEEKNN